MLATSPQARSTRGYSLIPESRLVFLVALYDAGGKIRVIYMENADSSGIRA